MDVLDRRTLTRATAQRQWLSERRTAPALDAVAHLLGLQAQEPQEPFTGLWSRLTAFDPHGLSAALEHRDVVRTHLMRRTIHLVTADDAWTMRPLHDAMLRQRVRPIERSWPDGVDLDALTERARDLFAAVPSTTPAVARTLFPDGVPSLLGDALISVVPVVQVPPRGLWRRTGPAACTTYEAWLGPAPEQGDADDVLAEVVRRYLRAYGPAATADVRSWSGIAGLPAVLKALGPELRTYRDERGRVLHDLLDGPGLPPADLELPVRFLPAFDNAVLGYDDRTRIIGDEHKHLSVAGARYVLVDGLVAATWTTSDRPDSSVEVAVEPLRRLAPGEQRAVLAEAERLAAFAGDGLGGAAVVSGA